MRRLWFWTSRNVTDSDLYLRYVLGEVDPEDAPSIQPERHLRCNPTLLAQFIVDDGFEPVVAWRAIFGKGMLDAGVRGRGGVAGELAAYRQAPGDPRDGASRCWSTRLPEVVARWQSAAVPASTVAEEVAAVARADAVADRRQSAINPECATERPQGAPTRRLFLDDDPDAGRRVPRRYTPTRPGSPAAQECIARLADPWDEVHLDHDLERRAIRRRRPRRLRDGGRPMAGPQAEEAPPSLGRGSSSTATTAVAAYMMVLQMKSIGPGRRRRCRSARGRWRPTPPTAVGFGAAPGLAPASLRTEAYPSGE